MSLTPTTKKKLGSIRPGVFADHIGEIYTPPFLMLQNKNLIYKLFIQKIPKITMAPMGKIKKFFKLS